MFTACSLTPQRVVTGDSEPLWQQRQQQLASVNHWSLNGRFSLQDRHESWNGVIQWQQAGAQQYQVRFIAPFGQGSIELSGSADGVNLRLSAEEIYYADDAELLLMDKLGWHVPVADLQRWALGLPGPGPVASYQLDAFGRLKELHQSQWKVSFRRYRMVEGRELPDKIFIDNHRIKLRLVVDEWQV